MRSHTRPFDIQRATILLARGFVSAGTREDCDEDEVRMTHDGVHVILHRCTDGNPVTKSLQSYIDLTIQTWDSKNRHRATFTMELTANDRNPIDD